MFLNAVQAILIASWAALSTQDSTNNRTIAVLTVQNATTGLIETAGQLGNQAVGLQVNTDFGIIFANTSVFDPDTAATFVPAGPAFNITLSDLRAVAKVRQVKMSPPEKASKAVRSKILVRPGFIKTKVGVASKSGYAVGDGSILGVAMAAIESADDLSKVIPSQAGFAVARRPPKALEPIPQAKAFLTNDGPRLAQQQAAAANRASSLRVLLDGSIPPPADLGSSSRRRKVAAASSPSGNFYIGADPSTFTGSLSTCKLLPAEVSTNWEMLLDNIRYGGAPLGYNGVVAVASSQFWSAVPQPFFKLITSLVNAPGAVITSGSAWRTYSFNCDPNSYAVGRPNITYVASGQSLVFTPYQYIYADKMDNRCYLSFAVNIDGSVPFPYTISTTLLNGTYTVFDPVKQAFSYGISG